MFMQNQIIVYQPDAGLSTLEVRLENETVWLTQNQMAELFQTDRTSIVKHIKNIYNTQSQTNVKKAGSGGVKTNLHKCQI